jgi:hypothetical protein
MLAIPALWFLVAACLPMRTWARRLMHAPIVLFAGIACLFTALAVLGLPCSPPVAAAATLCVLTLFVFAGPSPLGARVADQDDLLAIGLGALTATLLVIPLVHATAGEAMTAISQNSDGGNHVQLVLGTQRTGGYLAFHHVAGMFEGMSLYPGAWSAGVWLVGRLLLGHDLSPVAAVHLLGVLGSLTYALLTTCAARLALHLRRRLAPAPTRLAGQAMTVALIAASTTFGFGVFLLHLNAYTEIVALAAIMAALLALADDIATGPAVTQVTFAVIVVAQTWYLLLPVVAAVAVTTFGVRRPGRRHTLVSIGLGAPFVLFPLLRGPGAAHVRAGGYDVLPSLMGVLALLVASGVSVTHLLRRRQGGETVRLGAASAIVGALVLVAMLVLVQPRGAIGPTYYSAKALLALLFLGATCAAASGARYRTAASCSLVVICLLLATYDTRNLALPPRTAQTHGFLDPRELDAFLARHPSALSPGTDIWVADSCSRGLDRIMSRWPYDLYLTWTPDRPEAMDAYVKEPKDSFDVIAARTHRLNVTSVEVYVGKSCQSEQLQQLAQLPKVTVIRVR